MSEAPEEDSKTEEATSHKLQQAFEKGDGPRTMDLGSAATLAAVSGVILVAGGWLSSKMTNELTPFLSRAGSMSVEHGGPEILRHALMAGAPSAFAQQAAPATGVPPVSENKADTDTFTKTLASANRFEIDSSKLALKKKGVAADVKDFAELMVKDHTKAGQDFKAALERSQTTASVTPEGPPL
eukprot:gene65851-90107_t